MGGVLSWYPVAWADLNDGLVAHYPFNANANDESGNGNDGTVNGATLTEDRFGNVDGAYSFNGVDDYIERSFDPDFTPSTQSWTVAAWIKSGNGPIVSWYRCGANPSCYTVDSALYNLSVSDNFAYTVRDDSDRNLTVKSDTLTNSWHFVIGMLDRTKNVLKLYVDGSEVDNLPSNFGSLSHGNINIPFSIGRVFRTGWDQPSYYKGLIDDVRIYNRALSEDEVKELYELDKPNPDEPNPVTCSDGPATYSNETRQAILPCVEIPLYTDINGSPINITGLYSAVLEIPFGFSNFEAKELTFLEIIDESNPTHARFNPDSGILDIPRIDVPTTVQLLAGGTVPGPTLQCSAELQQSALRAEILILQEFDCNLP
jgi:hypothetical protein